MLIAASFILSYDLGAATTLAVIFHEISQEIGDFGILIYGGFTKRKALAYNFVSALTAVAGALITYYLAYIQGIEHFLVPFAAGGFIYIAATDLIRTPQEISCDRIYNPAICYSGRNRVNVGSENITIVSMSPKNCLEVI